MFYTSPPLCRPRIDKPQCLRYDEEAKKTRGDLPMNKRTKTILSLVALVAVVAVFVGVYLARGRKPLRAAWPMRFTPTIFLRTLRPRPQRRQPSGRQPAPYSG